MKKNMLTGFIGAVLLFALSAPSWAAIRCKDGKGSFTPPEGATAVSEKGECPSGTIRKSYCGGEFHYCVRIPTPWIVIPGEVMKPGKTVYSKNGLYHLTMQKDGNLVFYEKKKSHALWASKTNKNSGASATMQAADGNLVVASKEHKTLWSSGTGGHPGAYLLVQNDGNLVIYNGSKALWALKSGGLIPVPKPAPAPTPAPAPAPQPSSPNAWNPNDGTGVTSADYLAWSKVNVCEEGGNWHVNGSMFSGGLGISHTNWAAYGGQALYGDEATATPDQQIAIAKRIQSNPPDQNGCGNGW